MKKSDKTALTATSLYSLCVYLVSEWQLGVLLTSAIAEVAIGGANGANTYYAVVYTIISHLAELI